jgi:hypothetical protein
MFKIRNKVTTVFQKTGKNKKNTPLFLLLFHCDSVKDI